MIKVQSQPNIYADEENEKHLCGPFELNALTADTSNNKWYIESQEESTPDVKDVTWKGQLANKKVEIFLGNVAATARIGYQNL